MGAKKAERGRRLLRGPHFLRGEAELLLKLERELARLKRNGSALSLLLLDYAAPEPESLAEILTPLLEVCDSFCPIAQGCYALLLPGQGQLRARRLAEAISARLGKDHAPAARPSLGIVNISQGESGEAASLLERARLALGRAKAKPGQIVQESAYAKADKDTLVHSGEKHFLFFGAEKKQ